MSRRVFVLAILGVLSCRARGAPGEVSSGDASQHQAAMACSKVTLHPLEQYWADAYGKPGHVVEQPWTAIPAFSGSRPLGFKVVRLRQGGLTV